MEDNENCDNCSDHASTVKALADGQTYVAPCPRSAQALREDLKQVYPDQEPEVVVHGTEEHIQSLRKLHEAEASRRDALREQHPEVYEACETIHHKLSHLNHQIHELIASEEQHPTISRFGRNNRMRTYHHAGHLYDDDVSPSSNNSQDYDPAKQDEEISIKFLKRPVLRQYFHKGILWRSSELQEVGSFELFVDLIYVGILDIIGERVTQVPTGEHFHRYILFMFLTWKIWNDLMMFLSWFETDDIVQKLYILLEVVCLLGFAVNMLEAFAGDTWTNLICFYMVARTTTALYCLLQSCFIQGLRAMAIANLISTTIPLALWIGSIFVELPNRFALIWIPLILDSFGLTWTIFLQRDARRMSTRLQSWFDEHFRLYPAINIEHKSERFKQFVTLVIGSQILSMTYQNAQAFGLNVFFAKAFLGLLQGYALNWTYFEVDSKNIQVHAIRRHVLSSLLWLGIHLPFVISLGLAGAAMSRLVLAYDCPGADIHSLSELIDPEHKSIEHIEDGLRWFYCAGLGCVALTKVIISLSHIHKEATHARIAKRYRIVYRILVGLTLIGLSGAYHLNSLQLLGCTTCLICSVVVIEIYGSSDVHSSFFAVSNDKARQMKYLTLQMPRSDSDVSALRSDGMLKITRVATAAGVAGPEIYEAGFLSPVQSGTKLTKQKTRKRSRVDDEDFLAEKDDMLEAMYGV